MAETDIACSTGPAAPQKFSPRSQGRNRSAPAPTDPAHAWPARTDQRERCIVFDAMAEAERLLRGDGRDAALELLRGAKEAWRNRCNEIEGDPVEIYLRLGRGWYLGGRRFVARTLGQGCKLLSRVCPDLLVDMGGGRYCFPFMEFKNATSPRLERLEAWRRAQRAERSARNACGRHADSESGDVRGCLSRNARAIQFPPYYPDIGSTESGGGGRGTLEERAAAAWRDLCRLGPAVEGEGGDRRTFVACCIPTDYGLPDDVAEELLERWGQTCRPPWSPKEFFKKKGSASRNRKRPIAYKAPGLAHPPDPRRESAVARSEGAISGRDWWEGIPSLRTLEAAGPVQWAMSRGIDPAVLADRDLARVLPGFGQRLPKWATIAGQTWAEAGIRLVLPVYNADGELAGVRGRWTGPPGHVGVGEAPSAKEVAPWGQRSAGLIFANAAARAMLRGEGVSGVVTVVEGAPDFLTLAALTEAPVIGLFAGSWTAELAARVPDGAQVMLATHADRVGEGYARQVAATLLRRCTMARLRLPSGCDLNDAHRRGELATAEHERLEAIDLEVPMSLLERPELCAWDRRALVMLGRYGQRFRGEARELARVLLTVAEYPLEAVAVKALARALVRLFERRELPAGIVVQASAAELAELDLGRGDEDGEGEADLAVAGGVPGVQGEVANQAGPFIVDDGGGGLGVAAGAAADGAPEEDRGGELAHALSFARTPVAGASGAIQPSRTGPVGLFGEPTAESWIALGSAPAGAQRDAEAELIAAGVGEGRVFELGALDQGDVDLSEPPDRAPGMAGPVSSAPGEVGHRDFKPENPIDTGRPASIGDPPEDLVDLAAAEVEVPPGSSRRRGPLDLAELAERVDSDPGRPPDDGGSARAAAEFELMRALERAGAAVRDRLKRRGRDGPS